MEVITDGEVRSFVRNNSKHTGIRIDETGELFYDSPQRTA